MALVLKDRIRESSASAGTGDLQLDGAIFGFQSFASVGNGNTTYYAIVDAVTGEWEVGVGQYSSTGPTLSRNTVLESTNAGNKVNFTSNIKDVFCTYPAEQAVTLGDIQTLTNKTLTSPTITGGTLNGTSVGATTASTGAFTTLTSNSTTTLNGTTIPASVTLVSTAATQTLTNKTINLTSNTLVATSAQLAAALTDETGTGVVVFSASPALTGTPTAPTAAAGTNTTQIATTAHVFAERTNTATLTNKTISGANNTLSNIGNSSLTNSSITFGSTAQALGSTVSALNDVSIGASTASTGAFTTLSATSVTTVQAGTAAAPAITTFSNTNTGVFFPATDTIAFSEGGAESMRLNSAGNVVLAGSGTAAAPLLSIAGSTNTGIYSPSAGALAISTNGTLACTFTSGGDANIVGSLGVAGAAGSTSVTINASRAYTSNATRTGLSLATTITDATLTAARVSTGVINTITATQSALPFSLTVLGDNTTVNTASAAGVTSSITTATGSQSTVLHRGAGTVTTGAGAFNRYINNNAGSTTTTAFGTRTLLEVDAGTVTTGYGAYNALQLDGGTFTTGYGAFNFLDSNAGTFTNGIGTINDFDGTFTRKIGFVNQGAPNLDLANVEASLGTTTVKIGSVNAMPPTAIRVYGEAGASEDPGVPGVVYEAWYNVRGAVFSTLALSTTNWTRPASGVLSEAASLAVSDSVTSPLLNLAVNSTGFGNSTVLQAVDNTAAIFSNLQLGEVTITGNPIFSNGFTVNGVSGFEIGVFQANNNGITTDAALNILRFTDTDTTTTNNQPLGKIEFFTADTTAPGARVTAYILGAAKGTSGGGDIRFGTSANAGTVAESFRIDNLGALSLPVYNQIVGATNRDVFIDNTGRFGYVSSVRASKTNIQDITDTDWLLDLNPVSFNYRKKDEDGQYTEEADGEVPDFGLIAEDVEQVKPELCFYDETAEGKALRGVHYSKLVTPMLRLLQKQQEMITQLQVEVEALKGSK
jgi:hypothetical protein